MKSFFVTLFVIGIFYLTDSTRQNKTGKIEFIRPEINWLHSDPLPVLEIKTRLTSKEHRSLEWSTDQPEILTIDPKTGVLNQEIRGIGRSVQVTVKSKKAIGICKINIISDFPELDSSIINYMKRADVMGMSVAVVYKERLVYQRAYGNIDSGRPANVDHMFRIASMSKPITVIALLKLVEQGKLNLEEKIFGPGSVLGNDFGRVPDGSMKDLITVRHLIEHTSGWAGDMAYTGYNHYPDAGAMVSAGLAFYQLAFKPGERHLYSNFGYGVLGRVVEKRSGMPYHEFVRRYIIEPCGIRQMKLAKGPIAERDPNESNYFADAEQADMIHPAISNYFDSFGGWITTPTDYARFVLHTDRQPGIPDILPPEVLNLTYFKGNWSHGGMLPGTATNITRLTDDLTMIYMANTWRFHLPAFGEMYNAVREPIMARTSWPDYDFFDPAFFLNSPPVLPAVFQFSAPFSR